VTHGIGRTGMRILGWRLIGNIPDIPKVVVVAAPHTCTMDVFVGIAIMLASGLRVHWLGKHTIFWEPLGSVLRWIGGIPVDRTSPEGTAAQVARTMRQRDRFFLALAPEGTRKKVARWKTGFYRIAVGAGVPIVPVALDYRRKVADIGTPLVPTGDYDADLAILQKHFSAGMARHPERY
jgi:1-acyl-sn-glycerol-3-phosphate acyltransferase